MGKEYKTGQVAKIVGVSKGTLLGWLGLRKIKEPPRNVKGWRVWREEDVNAVKAFTESRRGGDTAL